MRFSEGRKSYLAHLIVSTLRKEGLAEVENERLVLAEIKQVLEQDYEVDARIDAAVRKKIASLSRRVPPGGREWDILYRQYYEEEARKHKPGGA
jgi:hypothetical protein